jgi:hypothetical protein
MKIEVARIIADKREIIAVTNYEQALRFLDVEKETADDYVVTMFVFKVNLHSLILVSLFPC